VTEEVSAAVLDGPRSIVSRQAADRVPAERAPIDALAGAERRRVA
jgi:hypothetical protein